MPGHLHRFQARHGPAVDSGAPGSSPPRRVRISRVRREDGYRGRVSGLVPPCGSAAVLREPLLPASVAQSGAGEGYPGRPARPRESEQGGSTLASHARTRTPQRIFTHLPPAPVAADCPTMKNVHSTNYTRQE
jgi:hypothetical protein